MSSRLQHPSQWMRWLASNFKRLLVFIVGIIILGAGLAMLVLPGPGIVVVVLGLLVLATEFAWAERALDRTKASAADAATKVLTSASRRALLALSASALVIGGGVVAVAIDKRRLFGLMLILVGAAGLAVLVPATQRWIQHPTGHANTSIPDPIPFPPTERP